MGRYVDGRYQPNEAGVFALCLVALIAYRVGAGNLGLIGLCLFVCCWVTFLAWVGSLNKE